MKMGCCSYKGLTVPTWYPGTGLPKSPAEGCSGSDGISDYHQCHCLSYHHGYLAGRLGG